MGPGMGPVIRDDRQRSHNEKTRPPGTRIDQSSVVVLAMSRHDCDHDRCTLTVKSRPGTALIHEACSQITLESNSAHGHCDHYVQHSQNEMQEVIAWQCNGSERLWVWLFARVSRRSRMSPWIFDPTCMSKRLRVRLHDALAAIQTPSIGHLVISAWCLCYGALSFGHLQLPNRQ